MLHKTSSQSLKSDVPKGARVVEFLLFLQISEISIYITSGEILGLIKPLGGVRELLFIASYLIGIIVAS